MEKEETASFEAQAQKDETTFQVIALTKSDDKLLSFINAGDDQQPTDCETLPSLVVTF